MATHSSPTTLPRVTIQFCTQCKWLLRAAYFAQELLSTFGTALGEVALQPSTGGTFIVEIYHASLAIDDSSMGDVEVQRHVLWDRKAEGGFPETKELKRRVRDIIDPKRDLGHVDGKKKSVNQEAHTEASTGQQTPSAEGKADEQPMVLTKGRAATTLVEAEAVVTKERKFTPMDVDIGESKKDSIKRNPDGSICEDCN